MRITKIIVGLGNPGKEYEKTRHNIGFRVIDYIAEKLDVTFNIKKFKSVYGIFENENENEKILFLKPLTFMNLSGDAVFSAMNFYKIPPENVLLIFDDIYLPVGKIRVRKKGSHGGQNGVKDITQKSGSQNFPRIKIGIGNKPHPNWDLSNWVLSKFTDEEEKVLEEIFVKVLDEVKNGFLRQ